MLLAVPTAAGVRVVTCPEAMTGRWFSDLARRRAAVPLARPVLEACACELGRTDYRPSGSQLAERSRRVTGCRPLRRMVSGGRADRTTRNLPGMAGAP